MSFRATLPWGVAEIEQRKVLRTHKVLVGVVGDISFLGFDEAQHCG